MEPCVELLSKRQRQVVELRFREGMRYSDIADRLGIPVGTVRSRLARARTVIDGLAGEPADGADLSQESQEKPAEAVADLVDAGPPRPVDASLDHSEKEPRL